MAVWSWNLVAIFLCDGTGMSEHTHDSRKSTQVNHIEVVSH
jgi:hypothetical protein